MKNKYTIILIVLVLTGLFLHQGAGAQVPQNLSYQAVIRDAGNELVSNTRVSLRISILQGAPDGMPVYSEIQTPQTNANGLITIEVGGEAGFNAIDWASGPYFIKTETDPTGNNNYTIVGVSQLLSVPYALYALESGTPGPQGAPVPTAKMVLLGDYNLSDGINVNFEKGATNQLRLYWDGNPNILTPDML